MKGWLAYGAAFGCALFTAFFGAYAASYVALSGPIWSLAQLLLFAFIAPIAAAVVVFGLTYPVFTGRGFGQQEWISAGVVVTGATLLAGVLVLTGVIKDSLAMVILPVVLFLAGAAMHARHSNA